MTIYDIIIVMKNNILTILCCTAVLLVLSACIEPVGLGDFFNDQRVKEIIEDRDPDNQVEINPGFDEAIEGRLRPGNTRINGIRPDRYYLVREIGPGHPASISYVQPDGTLSPDIEDIGFVPGGRILGLNNLHEYTVRAARPFLDKQVNIFANPTGGTSEVSGNIENGAINLPGLAANFYLEPDLAAIFLVAKIPVYPPGANVSFLLTPGERIPLADENTITDYVFVQVGNEVDNFTVLRVEIGHDDRIFLTVEFDGDDTVDPVVTGPSSMAASAVHNGSLIITINNWAAMGFTNAILRYNEVEVAASTTGTLSVVFDVRLPHFSQLDHPGEHVFTITVDRNVGGTVRTYSAFFTLTVDP